MQERLYAAMDGVGRELARAPSSHPGNTSEIATNIRPAPINRDRGTGLLTPVRENPAATGFLVAALQQQGLKFCNALALRF